MHKPIMGVVIVAVGVLTGVVASALLYAIITGLPDLWSGADGTDVAPSLWRRAWLFGVTFGLLAGARLGLEGAYRWFGTQTSGALLLARGICVVLLGVAIWLLLTEDRWAAIFDGISGGVVLIVGWMAMIHLLTKAISAQTRRPAQRA
jgi:hypothetical protein